MLKLCMQNYKYYGVQDLDHGSYTVNGTTCVEAKINGVVSRITLQEMNFNDFVTNKSKILSKTPKGKKRKRVESVKAQQKTPEKVKRFNGDFQEGKRRRKPNSMFSDFITSSNYNLAVRTDSEPSIESHSEDDFLTEVPKHKVMKSNTVRRVQKTRVKERILSNTDDEQRLDAFSTVDPLDIHRDDDVVHSFLPMFEVPPVLNYDETDKEKKAKPSTSKVNVKKPQVGPKPKDSVNKSQVLPSEGVITKPITVLSKNLEGKKNNSSQMYGKVLCMPLILTTNSQSPVMNANDVSNQQFMLLSKGDQRWVKIQPKLATTPVISPYPVKNKKVTPPPKNNIRNKDLTPKVNNVSKAKPEPKPKPPEPKPKPPKIVSRYILVDGDTKYKPPKVSDIDFNKLVRSLKSVKLPAKNWKIRIIVSPQETITEVIFTNKEVVERCVKFARAVGAGYKITFGKAEVKLLGAPTLQTFEDIARLLEIVDTVSSDSHVLEYC